MICYEDYTNSEGMQARRAYVTIHVDKFEDETSIKTTNSSHTID